MRIGFISQWYDPEQGSAALPGVIARALAARGHSVHVLTGYPNYPHGELYPGYRVRFHQREIRDGLEIHRAPLWVNHDSNAIRRSGNYLSFAAGSAAVALTKFPRVDAFWVHSTPATAAFAAWLLHRARSTPFVIHIQDLWPDTVTASGFLADNRASMIEKALNAFCDRIYHRASAVAATAPGMLGRLDERGVPQHKLTYLPNWADESAFRPLGSIPSVKNELGLDDRFAVMYAGNFGEFQDLHTFVEAATLLRSRLDVQFVLVGGGVEEARLREMVTTRELTNVRFLPPQPFASMARVLAAGDVQLISLQDRQLSRMTLPSKLQATLAAGRPIIGALAGDAAQVVSESGAGIATRPGNAEELASAVSFMASRTPDQLAAMGLSARRHYDARFSQERGLDSMTTLLEQAVAGRPV